MFFFFFYSIFFTQWVSFQLLILSQEEVALLCLCEHFGFSSWAKGNICGKGQSVKETKLLPFISTTGYSAVWKNWKKIMSRNGHWVFFVPKKDKFGEERNWEISNLCQSDIQKIVSYCFTCISLITIEMNCPWMYLLATDISFVHCFFLLFFFLLRLYFSYR